MPVKVTRNFDFSRVIGGLQREFNRSLQRVAKDEIKESILSGRSPVEGFGRFSSYSKKYARIKGRRSPRDLFVTGGLIESLSSKASRAGRLSIFFTDKLAAIHNGNVENKKKQGVKLRNGVPVSRILPDRRGETFNNRVLTRIVRAYNRRVGAVTSATNR